MSRLLLILTATLALAASAVAQATTWQIDPNHTAAQFSVRHLGISTVRGAFTKVSGTVTYDPADPGKTVIDVTIDANSVDTRVEMRDNDLRSPNFFDVAKFPTLTFKSKHAEANGAGKLKVTGDLTIHGVTKEVVLDVEGPSEPVKDPARKLAYGCVRHDQRSIVRISESAQIKEWWAMKSRSRSTWSWSTSPPPVR